MAQPRAIRLDYVAGMRVPHSKLVRDRIPEIIQAAGGHPVIRVLDDTSYRAALLAKLVEEAQVRACSSRYRSGSRAETRRSIGGVRQSGPHRFSRSRPKTHRAPHVSASRCGACMTWTGRSLRISAASAVWLSAKLGSRTAHKYSNVTDRERL